MHSSLIEAFNWVGVFGSDPDVGFLAKNWAGLHTLVRSGGGGGDDI